MMLLFVACSEQRLASTNDGSTAACDTVCTCDEPDNAAPDTAPAPACGGVSTPEDLERELVGTWRGTVYTADYPAAVSLVFGSDQSFTIDFAGDDGVDDVTCSDIVDQRGGVSYEVMGPSLVMVSIENEYYPQCGEELERAALHDVWISDQCVLTAYSESPSLWGNTNKGIFRLTRE